MALERVAELVRQAVKDTSVVRAMQQNTSRLHSALKTICRSYRSAGQCRPTDVKRKKNCQGSGGYQSPHSRCRACAHERWYVIATPRIGHAARCGDWNGKRGTVAPAATTSAGSTHAGTPRTGPKAAHSGACARADRAASQTRSTAFPRCATFAAAPRIYHSPTYSSAPGSLVCAGPTNTSSLGISAATALRRLSAAGASTNPRTNETGLVAGSSDIWPRRLRRHVLHCYPGARGGCLHDCHVRHHCDYSPLRPSLSGNPKRR